jgi:predicted GNAT family acetyltransferase
VEVGDTATRKAILNWEFGSMGKWPQEDSIKAMWSLGQVVCAISYRDEGRGTARVTNTYTVERLRCKGLARALFGRLCRELAAKGYQSLVVSPVSGAERFYAKLGFVKARGPLKPLSQKRYDELRCLYPPGDERATALRKLYEQDQQRELPLYQMRIARQEDMTGRK